MTPTGQPLLTAIPSIVNGHLVVTIANTAAPGNTTHWRLDVTLNHSFQQTTSGNTGANWTIVVFNSGGAGVPAPQNLAQTYAIGTLSAHQTMTLTDANGGGIIVDGTSSGNHLLANRISSTSGVDVSDNNAGNCWLRNVFSTGTVPACP